MTRPLPLFAILLGLAGLLPFAGCGLGALSPDPALADRSLLALVAYGSVILAFLGGVHWGFALDGSGADGSGAPTVRVQRLRFGLGVLPSLLGWAALMLAFVGWPLLALVLLAAGVIATTLTEARATRQGLAPQSYMRLRWVLSAGVLVCFAGVCLVRALGGRLAP